MKTGSRRGKESRVWQALLGEENMNRVFVIFFAEPSTEIPLIGIMGAIYGWFHKVAASG